MTMTLPGVSDLDKLADLTSQFAGVSIQYNPQKLHGTVRLAVRGQVTPAELWAVFNQVLIAQGFTTVITGLPPVYVVVPLTDAAGLSAVLSDADNAKLPYKPGYGVIVHELTSISAEPAVKLLGALLGAQTAQVRTLGNDGHKLMLSAPQDKIREALEVLTLVDRPGIVPAVQLYRPERASPQTIQTSATAAWAALGRIGEQPALAEIQVAPDGAQVVLITSSDQIERLKALAQSLDDAEPQETRSFRPRYFDIDEVSSLLKQLMHNDRSGASQIDIIRDKLTNSLIIKATVAQLDRITEVMKTLDNTPAAARRQLRTFAVKNRQADEIAHTITSLLSAGLGQTGAGAGHASSGGIPQNTPTGDAAPHTTTLAAPAPPEVGNQQNGAASTPAPALATNAGEPPPPPAIPASGGTIATTQDNSVVIASDLVTNRLIVLGDPRAIDQVATMLKELDQRQPQVQIEVILVTLSSDNERTLGVELVDLIHRGAISGSVGSLFGLSTSGADPTLRTLTANGLSGVVMHPGDFAGVVSALDTINNGHAVTRSQVVANNNVKATINGVIEQPLVANNSNTTVSTTSISGSDDAGTQIVITPQISSADYLTLSYSITQSAFIGATTFTSDGTPIPPNKSSNTISSVATIPDGFIIALGGLTTKSTTRSEARIPLLGSIPYLGALFRNRSDSDSDSRFYVFIHATILRHNGFADLRYLSDQVGGQAELPDHPWPQPKPRFVE